MAKGSKNVNAAVRAEELRGRCAGFYIDKTILASAKMVRLPDGTMKLEQDMTEHDYEDKLMAMAEKHNLLPSKNSRKKTKR